MTYAAQFVSSKGVRSGPGRPKLMCTNNSKKDVPQKGTFANIVWPPKTGKHTPFLYIFDIDYWCKWHKLFVGKVGQHGSRQTVWQRYKSGSLDGDEDENVLLTMFVRELFTLLRQHPHKFPKIFLNHIPIYTQIHQQCQKHFRSFGKNENNKYY